MLTEGMPRDTPVVIGVGMVWIQPKGRIEVGYCSLMLTEVAPREPPIVIGVGMVWIQSKGRIEVSYRSLMLTEVAPRGPPIVIGVGMVWIQSKGRIISIYCCIEIRFIFVIKKIADRKPTMGCTLVVGSFCDIGDRTPFLNSLVSPVF